MAQNDTELRTDDRRGILPLMQWLSDGEFLRGAVVADKVIGKAAAFLLVLGGGKHRRSRHSFTVGFDSGLGGRIKKGRFDSP